MKRFLLLPVLVLLGAVVGSMLDASLGYQVQAGALARSLHKGYYLALGALMALAVMYAVMPLRRTPTA